MKKHVWQAGMLLLLAATVGSLSGCGQRVTDNPPQPVQVQSETQPPVTEAVTETETKKETETQKETQTEPLRRVTDVDYTSKDGTIKITLPDNTWKIGQDADEMRVFQSGKDAMINIVHASTEAAMSSLNVMTTQQALEASLTEQYADANAFKVQSFVDAPVGDVHVYRYVVQYNSPARMWAYSVTNAIIAPDQAYVVIGSITEDNKNLLEAVQKSVASFRVLKDEKLKAVTGEVITGTIQSTSETIRTDTASSEEMQSLKDYGTTASLVTVDQVNVRLSPGTDANVLITLDKNAAVTVTGETANWFQVSVNGTTGYIRKDFLVYATAAAAAEGQSETTASETTADPNSPYSATSAAELGNATNYGASTTLYATSDVNIRALPGTDSDITGGLGNGSSVTVIGETDNWFIVSVDGGTGYVSKAYLSSDAPAAQPAPDNTGQTAADGTANGGTATDGTANGGNGTGTATDGTANGGTGTATDGTANGGAGTATDGTANGGGTQTEAAQASTQSNVSGTVIGTTPDSITVQGDDGQTYNVYYGDANMNSADGIYDGVYVSINLDSTQAASDGTLYATDVTGY